MVHLSSLSSCIPGQLYLYAAGRVAFESPVIQELATTRKHKLILLGGLSDGLWPVPYTELLYQQAIAPKESCWSLVQPILSSSYLGFDHGSLDRDTRELDELFEYLLEHRQYADGGDGCFGIVGHSTGCQNAVHYMKHGKYKELLKVVALQAPVSDREHAQLEDDYAKNIRVAESLRNKGSHDHDELMPRSAFWAPITASRFLDLQQVGGADDMFSSDFTDEQLVERLGHVGQQVDRKVLVASSGADEYVPDTIVGGDSKVLLDRLVRAMNAHCPGEEPVATGLYMPNANHNLSEAPGDSDLFVRAVSELLQKAT